MVGRWFKSCIFLLIAAVAAGHSMMTAGTSIEGQPVTSPRLSFGQFIALSDLDGDKAIDRATLDATGFTKSIRVSLSSNQTSSLLRFTTSIYSPGSLFAYDIDNDGDIDLIWTDLIHPDQVVVWINDGSGRFERGSHAYCTDSFIVGGATAGVTSGHPLQVAAAQPNRTSLDQPCSDQNSIDTLSGAIHSTTSRLSHLSCVISATGVRGPPITIS